MTKRILNLTCALLLMSAGTALAQEPEEEESWLDKASFGMFVDSYYNVDWNMPDNPQANGSQSHRAYVRTQGFALSFLGFEAAYTDDLFGATASLRFGPSAANLIGYTGDDLNLGIQFVKQAYVTLTPTESLTIDFGQFDTIYGAEVADSWANVNYTRGALYFLMQPFWHQGLRLGVQASDAVGFKFLVVNGVNQQFDDDRAVDLGAQLALTPSDVFSAYIGYYGSPIEPDGRNWSHFVDVVATLAFDPLLIVFNGDLGIRDELDGDGTSTFYGLSLAARLALAEKWGLGLRGEYLSEGDDLVGTDFGTATDFPGEYLATATVTLEYLPTDNLVLRLDGRLETAGVDLFFDDTEGAFNPTGMPPSITPNTDTYFSTVLGVVVKTN